MLPASKGKVISKGKATVKGEEEMSYDDDVSMSDAKPMPNIDSHPYMCRWPNKPDRSKDIYYNKDFPLALYSTTITDDCKNFQHRILKIIVNEAQYSVEYNEPKHGNASDESMLEV